MTIPNPGVAAVSAVILALAVGRPTATAAQGARLPPAVELRVPKPPTVASGGGTSFVVYELHITNFAAPPLGLRRIEVLRATDGQVLLSLEDSALARALARPGVSPAPPAMERARLGGGLRAVAFLWVRLGGGSPPAELLHRVTLTQGTSDTATPQSIEGANAAVTPAPAAVGPPVRGGAWYAANGPDSASGHRRALIAAVGLPTIAQRFGIDWLRLDEGGRSHSGDPLLNDSYYAEGQEAIAVADGIVAATKDGIPENIPGINSRAVPITLETVGGNHVIIDIGGGRYAFYAHLKPGSLRVRVGDRVTRGQVVGLVGNSGNSTEPHLHFHIMDGTSPLGSEGIPYTIETFDLIGRCERVLQDCSRAKAETRRREMPMANAIIRFPE
jgi:murein DD-endopeptidase MepM/ murein hydrolase activator NlpD